MSYRRYLLLEWDSVVRLALSWGIIGILYRDCDQALTYIIYPVRD